MRYTLHRFWMIAGVIALLVATVPAARANATSGEERSEHSGSSARGEAGEAQRSGERAPRPFLAYPYFDYDYYYGPFFDDGSPFGWYSSWYYPWYYSEPFGFGPRSVPALPRTVAAIELSVRPRKAELYVDGNILGQARDFDSVARPLVLAPGKHVLELDYPGFESLRIELRAHRGENCRLHYRLHRGEGVDPRSSEAKAALSGRVHNS